MTIERDINEPIIYKLYYKIRKTLTPTQNIYYLLSESVFIGLILFYLLYTYTIINELIIVFTSFSFVISILVRFLFIEPDKKNREDIVLKFDTKQSIYSYIVSIIPLVTLFIFYNIFNILLLLVLFNFVYVYTLYYRSKSI